MDIKTKLNYLYTHIDSISKHDDKAVAFRTAALTKAKEYIDAEIERMAQVEQDEINNL